MKYDLVVQPAVGIFELQRDNLLQATLAINMQVVWPAHEMHSEYQTHQPQVVVAMEVADKDVFNLPGVGFIKCQPLLCSFTTIYQKMMPPNL